jgi:hypothetical protein
LAYATVVGVRVGRRPAVDVGLGCVVLGCALDWLGRGGIGGALDDNLILKFSPSQAYSELAAATGPGDSDGAQELRQRLSACELLLHGPSAVIQRRW